jgi:hypothetical protein
MVVQAASLIAASVQGCFLFQALHETGADPPVQKDAQPLRAQPGGECLRRPAVRFGVGMNTS